MDLIGPWIVQVCGDPYEFSALTAIDTVTNLVELIMVEDKYSETVARKYAQCWLSCYPWPQRCIHDPGTEYAQLQRAPRELPESSQRAPRALRDFKSPIIDTVEVVNVSSYVRAVVSLIYLFIKPLASRLTCDLMITTTGHSCHFF